MANISDYLDWRGDVSFAAAPFNEIDNLILTELCFLDLNTIVPSDPRQPPVRFEEAAKRYFILHPLASTSMGLIVPQSIPPLAVKASQCRRFRDICVTAFVNIIDTRQEEQFSATTYLLGDGTAFVAFRGTDDTLVGWKENFNMAFRSTIPAQASAARYVNNILDTLPHPLRVGGHSKGGNLAIFAAVHANPAKRYRIMEVYSNDGPGFSSDLLASEAYRTLAHRVISIVPESSVVGMLLNHEENYQVVKSDAKGLFQHDGFSWQVLGPHFVTISDRSQESKYTDKTLKAWLADMDDAQRERFVDALYSILANTNAQTLTELNADWKGLVASLFSIDAPTRDILWKTLLQLVNASRKIRFSKGEVQKPTGESPKALKDAKKSKKTQE